MLRKAMIVLLTAVALTGGLTADAFTRSGGEGGGVGHGAGSAVAFIWAAALAEAISPVVAWLTSPNITDITDAVIRLLAYGHGMATTMPHPIHTTILTRRTRRPR